MVSSASVTGAGAQGAQGCTEGGSEGGSEGQGVSEMFPVKCTGGGISAGWSKESFYKNDQQSIPSGKRLHSYGKSPFSMGKSTINSDFQ